MGGNSAEPMQSLHVNMRDLPTRGLLTVSADDSVCQSTTASNLLNDGGIE
jgi:hypothetical protein